MTLFSKKRSYDTAFIPEVDEKTAQDYDKGFTESFIDNWNFQTYTANSYSRTDNLHDEFAKDIELIEQKTGEKVKNPFNSALKEFFIEDVALGLVDAAIKNPFDPKSSRFHPENVAKREEERIDEYYKKVNKLKEQYPDLQFRDLKTINQDIKKQALKYYEKVYDGRDSSLLGDFLGAATGTVIDPINAVATLISGGGNAAKTTVAKALGKTAIGEFLVNSGVEAVIQPSVYQYKKELDIPYSKTEAVANVATAGISSAIIGTTAKALNMGARELLSKYKKATAKGIKFDAKTQEAADFLQNQVDFDDWSKETNILGDEPESVLLHNKTILDTERRLTEEINISESYDKVLQDPAGDAMEVLAQITPEDMETVWINRGGYNGGNNVKGSGFGMVKFIFKHGEKSENALGVLKSDVVDFPRIIREYEPIINDIYGQNRTWSIKRADGKQVIYADRIFSEDGQRHLVTIHTVDKNTHKLSGIFSEEKSRRTQYAVHTKDTAQEPYYWQNESSAEASSPKSRFHDGGDFVDNIIVDDTPKVKDYEGISFEGLEKEIDDDIELSVDDKAQAKEYINQMRKEETWDNEIIDCILEFKQK